VAAPPERGWTVRASARGVHCPTIRPSSSATTVPSSTIDIREMSHGISARLTPGIGASS
jgi:hypothetical protein